MSAVDKQYRWFKVAESAAELFNTGRSLVQVSVAGKDICITRHQQELHGCAAKCPHAGGRMADGWVDALGNVVCPLHRYKFSLSTGRNTSGEGYFLRTYPVKETEDGLFVGIEVVL
ncbi:Rieske (2Fe-2S) protein [Phnomibacter sp. MR]|uniref:Rieske (2Fe-2S) protein n=1 Tax=Phnomibacter sp. MR TaxID=3042318 RepID=UPI003A7FB580